jgi:hypothetical protein
MIIVSANKTRMNRSTHLIKIWDKTSEENDELMIWAHDFSDPGSDYIPAALENED